jgi:predicted nucleic acid-binding protein
MRVALDSNVFIYALEDTGVRGDQAAELLSRIASYELGGLASTLCLAEIMAGPWLESETNGEEAQLYLEAAEGIDFIPVTTEIALRSSRLRAAVGGKVGLADALHLATAVHEGADVFVTNDKALTKLKIEGLNIRLLGEPLD